jgi:hypothetical protein
LYLQPSLAEHILLCSLEALGEVGDLVVGVVDRGDSDLGGNATGCRRNIEDIDLQVGLPGPAEEVGEHKAGRRLVGVVRTVNCAPKPLEKCVMGLAGGEVITESVSDGGSVLDRLKVFGRWFRPDLSRPSGLSIISVVGCGDGDQAYSAWIEADFSRRLARRFLQLSKLKSTTMGSMKVEQRKKEKESRSTQPCQLVLTGAWRVRWLGVH